jgi:hypothetical protein
LLVIIGFVLAPIYSVAVIEQGRWYFLVVLASWFLHVMYYWLTKLINSSCILSKKMALTSPTRHYPALPILEFPQIILGALKLNKNDIKAEVGGNSLKLVR